MQAKPFIFIYCLFILYIYYVKVADQCFDAFNYGRKEEALRLLKKINDPRTVKDSNNFTLLHCAAYHGWLDVVKELINVHRFDPNCKDDSGNTPLSKARSNGKQSVVDYLETPMDGVDVQCYDAFNKGRKEEALRLLKQVKDPHAVKSKNNFTLLHCAAYHGWLAVVKELINDYKFDPDCMDDDCNTAISKARANGKQPVVDYLETVIEKKCYDAFDYGRREEALRLLKQVKDPRTVMSNNNFTLLHCAAYHGWLPVVKQLILKHDFDPDCKDNDGNTPLSKARGNGKQPVVDYLEKRLGKAPTPPKPNKGNSHEEETDQGYGRHRDLLMKSPELDDVLYLMDKLSSQWHDIGGKLRVPIGERNSLLKEARISDVGKLEEVLNKWITSQTSDVTWKKILDMLVAFEKKTIASEVTSFLDTQEAYDKYACQPDYRAFRL